MMAMGPVAGPADERMVTTSRLKLQRPQAHQGLARRPAPASATCPPSFGAGPSPTTENVKSGTFDYPHDLDTFRVDMVTGQRYLFSLMGTGTSPPPRWACRCWNSKG